MANSSSATLRIIKPAVILSRIVVGLTFLFSGFVKGVDPIGVSIKLKEYFVALGIDILSPSSSLGADFVTTFSIASAVALSIFEFVLGAAILFGIYRKLAPTFAVITMLFMTPLTLYLAIKNPVQDCGCFGEAVVLTNWQTFYKNLILTFAATILLFYNHKVKELFVKSIRWLPTMFSIFYILSISILSYLYQPVLDFRPYKSGINIREAMKQEEVVPEYLFLYEKDGEQKEFTIDNAPMNDPTWSFVDRIERLPEGVEQKEELDFNVRDNDLDITADILSDENYTFLLLVPTVEGYDNSWDDKIFNLYDYAFEHSYNFYALTPDVDLLNDRLNGMGILFPCYTMDETVIETIARGNPAVAMLKDGILYWKISPRDLLDMAQYETDIQSTPLDVVYEYNHGRRYIIILAIYILPLIFLYLCEQAVVLLVEKVKAKRSKLKEGKEAEERQKTTQAEDLDNTNYKPKNIKTMRKNIVAGNWKMNKTLQEGVELAKGVEAALNERTPNCDVIIGTPFIHLATIAATVDTKKLGLSAENCADKVSGAYTGEVSAAMVASTGAEYVILGHSERRAYYGETAEILKEKVLLALANNLKVIFCIGEVLEEREAGKEFDVVKAQIEESLFNLAAEDWSNIILAYEPVWAIGTGKTATAEQAQEMHAFIRKTVAEKYGEEVAEATSILYGGSCKPSNAKELFANKDVDGGLIGGASLDVEQFMGIVDAF
ncbi:MAG: triose-phosphate isomerase [Muribaculaceae bacterium]|nr:triose-phosphate isomerase [Muribaculaceae bacterium]